MLIHNIASFLTLSEDTAHIGDDDDDDDAGGHAGRLGHHHHHHLGGGLRSSPDHHHHHLGERLRSSPHDSSAVSSPTDSWVVGIDTTGGGGGTTGTGTGLHHPRHQFLEDFDDGDGGGFLVDASTANASFASLLLLEDNTPSAGGTASAGGGWLSHSSIETPQTPALVAVSPTGATPRHPPAQRHHHGPSNNNAMLYGENIMHRGGQDNTGLVAENVDDNAAISAEDEEYDYSSGSSGGNSDDALERALMERRRQWAQQKLATAVFSHPCSLRSFCLEAHAAAKQILQEKKEEQQQQQQEQQQQLQPPEKEKEEEESPETLREPDEKVVSKHGRRRKRPRRRTGRRDKKSRRRGRGRGNMFLNSLVHVLVIDNVPISIMIQVVDATMETSMDSTVAVFTITVRSVHGVASALGRALAKIGDAILTLNPFAVLEAIISLQFNAMGKTSEVLVSGIQSVGSASSLALHRLSSVASMSAKTTSAYYHTGATAGSGGLMNAADLKSGGPSIPSPSAMKGSAATGATTAAASGGVFNKNLLKKLSTINQAANVVSYTEIRDDTGGLNKHARSRVQRMLHYDVSLRPFVVTVEKSKSLLSSSSGAPTPSANNINAPETITPDTKMSAVTTSTVPGPSMLSDMTMVNMDTTAVGEDDGTTTPPPFDGRKKNNSPESSQSSSDGSPISSSFLCTPHSFPPSPQSRHMVMSREYRRADDVVFLARDKLIVHNGLTSSNERTRDMAQALRETKRLAVFDDIKDVADGIELSCGQHMATKKADGNMLYCSTRSMVPVLRNCYVYFEILVVPSYTSGTTPLQASMSIGLSTGEMPPNTLVGTWQGSVGLCTTGQILMAGQWFNPVDPGHASYGDSATVGCLVCLDDGSAFETWDGLMVTATVTFNVNGVVVPSPVSTMTSSSGGPGPLQSASNLQMGLMAGAYQQPHPHHHHQQQQLASSSSSSEDHQTQQQPPPPSHQVVAPSTTLPLLVPAAEDLYPTVTLHSPATSVMCRFSAQYVTALTRESIGAPPGVPVYAVDGTVVFDADNDGMV